MFIARSKRLKLLFLNLSWTEKIRDKFDRYSFGGRRKRDKALAILNRSKALVLIYRFFYLLTEELAICSSSEYGSLGLEGRAMSNNVLAKQFIFQALH